MKSIAAILVFLSAGAFAVAPRVLGNKQECAIWGMAFLTITLVGFIWAKRYRAFLPEGERQRLRMSFDVQKRVACQPGLVHLRACFKNASFPL